MKINTLKACTTAAVYAVIRERDGHEFNNKTTF